MFFYDIETERLTLKNIPINNRDFKFRHFPDDVSIRHLYYKGVIIVSSHNSKAGDEQ